jgi:hypothetical protein
VTLFIIFLPSLSQHGAGQLNILLPLAVASVEKISEADTNRATAANVSGVITNIQNNASQMCYFRGGNFFGYVTHPEASFKLSWNGLLEASICP